MRERLAFIVIALSCAAACGQEYTFELHTGSSVHASNTLHVHQAGHEPVAVTGATYTTRPFSHLDSLVGLSEDYYGLRLGYYPEAARPGEWGYGVELEFLHDKAYYEGGDDPDGVVRHFELSDGLNQLMFNVTARYPLLADEAFPSGRLHLLARVGLGPAITAPASVVRGERKGTRVHMGDDVFYDVAGPSGQVALQARYFVARSTALSLELKGTVAHTRNTIANGYARATFQGVHLNAGVVLQLR